MAIRHLRTDVQADTSDAAKIQPSDYLDDHVLIDEELVILGTGSPEGVLAAPVGRLYRDTATPMLYVKAFGAGNTGWATLSKLVAEFGGTVFVTGAVTIGYANPVIEMNDTASAVDSRYLRFLLTATTLRLQSVNDAHTIVTDLLYITRDGVVNLLDLTVVGKEMLFTGNGRPEGVLSAAVGRLYRDTASGLRYEKHTGAGVDGWTDARHEARKTRKAGWIDFFPGNITPIGVGLPGGLSTGGTISDGSSGTNAANKFATSAAATIGTWPNASVYPWQSRHNLSIYADITTGPSLATVRFLIGFAWGSQWTADNLGASHCGFRFSTSASDSGWMGVCRGDAGAQSVSAQIAAIAVNTRYQLRMRVLGNGTSIQFSINGGPAVVMNTNLPTVDTGMNWMVGLTNLAAVAQQITISNVVFEWD